MIRSKNIEGRLNQDDWAEMREGDRIDWVNEDFGFKREFSLSVTDIFTIYLKEL